MNRNQIIRGSESCLLTKQEETVVFCVSICSSNEQVEGNQFGKIVPVLLYKPL